MVKFLVCIISEHPQRAVPLMFKTDNFFKLNNFITGVVDFIYICDFFFSLLYSEIILCNLYYFCCMAWLPWPPNGYAPVVAMKNIKTAACFKMEAAKIESIKVKPILNEMAAERI